MHPDYRGMAFLLSLGAMPLACSGGEGGEDGSTTASTPATGPGTTGPGTGPGATDPGTTGSGTTGSPTGGPGTPTSTTASTDPSTGEAVTTTGPGTGTGESTTFVTSNTDDSGGTTGLPPTDDEGCMAYAAKLVECYPRYADYRGLLASQCAAYKMMGLESDGQPCADAIEASNVCLSQAACADLEADVACPVEQMMVESACPNLIAGETDDSGGFADTGG